MYTLSMKSIIDMPKHTTTNNFKTGTINGSIITCQINPIWPVTPSRPAGNMFLADDKRSIGLIRTDTIKGSRKAQKYVTLSVSVCAWLYRGVPLCEKNKNDSIPFAFELRLCNVEER